MATFCITKEAAKKLKDSALRSELDIAKLYNLSSAARREYFIKNSDVETGKFINAEFEKAMVSDTETAFEDFAKKIFSSGEKKKPVYETALKKIQAIRDMGVLDEKAKDAVLEDLISDKLGVSASPEEVLQIEKRAKTIEEAQVKLGNDIGNPLKPEENLAFFKAKKEMADYLNGLVPSNRLKVLTGTIGRGMMLASAKSPLLNIASNIEIGLTEAVSRRIANKTTRTTDNQLAGDYVKMARRIYQETGFDISRMMSISDTETSGERVLGDTPHSQGKGVVRKVGRVVEDIVFKQLMGAPDVEFASRHFVDSINMQSRLLAKGDKTKAREYMIDSMRLQPETLEGEILKGQAVLDAQVATWTNKTWASQVSLGIRKIMNDLSGNLRAGDYFEPFVKTPANVVATGMDYAGLGALKGVNKIYNGVKNGTIRDESVVRGIARDIVRSGLGLVGAYLFSQLLDDDDFVGSYDPARAQIEQLRGSNTNSFRIGDKWISTAWLGPLAVPVTAMMYARKYGDTPAEKAFQYGKGVVMQATDIPGISGIVDFARKQSYKKNKTLGETLKETQDFALGEAFSRLVPSLVGDIAKATDRSERSTSGSTTLGIANRIPGLRQNLPEKKDIFGDTIKTEPWLSSLLLGSRVKTSKETPVIRELNRVMEETDNPITFTDWDKSSGLKLEQFKKKVGDKVFEKAKIEYGRGIKNRLERVMADEEYKALSSEDKARLLNTIDADIMKMVFENYNFEYETQRKEKLPEIE